MLVKQKRYRCGHLWRTLRDRMVAKDNDLRFASRDGGHLGYGSCDAALSTVILRDSQRESTVGFKIETWARRYLSCNIGDGPLVNSLIRRSKGGHYKRSKTCHSKAVTCVTPDPRFPWEGGVAGQSVMKEQCIVE